MPFRCLPQLPPQNSLGVRPETYKMAWKFALGNHFWKIIWDKSKTKRDNKNPTDIGPETAGSRTAGR
jgi:hypothetical protein